MLTKKSMRSAMTILILSVCAVFILFFVGDAHASDDEISIITRFQVNEEKVPSGEDPYDAMYQQDCKNWDQLNGSASSQQKIDTGWGTLLNDGDFVGLKNYCTGAQVKPEELKKIAFAVAQKVPMPDSLYNRFFTLGLVFSTSSHYSFGMVGSIVAFMQFLRRVFVPQSVRQLPYQGGASGCPGTFKYWLFNAHLGDLSKLLVWPYFKDMEQLFPCLASQANSQDDDGNTPVHVAIKAFVVPSTALPGAQKNWVVHPLNTIQVLRKRLLLRLAQYGLIAMLRAFRQNQSFNVNLKNKNGETALHLAVEKGLFETVRLLVGELNASIELETKSGETALDYAQKYHHSDIFTYLIQKGASYGSSKDDRLVGGALFFSKLKKDTVNNPSFLKANEASFTYVDASGETIVHKLVRAECSTKILEKFATQLDFNVPNNQGERPYDLAITLPGCAAELKQYLFERLPWYVKASSLIGPYIPAIVLAVGTCYAFKWACQSWSNEIEAAIKPYGFSLGARWSVNKVPLSTQFPFVKSPVSVVVKPSVLPFTTTVSKNWVDLAETF